MKRLLLVILLSAAMFFTAGCSVKPSKVDKNEAVDMSEKITYFQDERTGLCFAVIATRKAVNASQSGIGLTQVPCESVKDLLVN